MPKTPETLPPVESDLPFERALTQLEELVREMESDELPLEDLIKHYETGTQLFRICEKRLDEAEGRIEIIRKKRNGENVLEAFETEDAATTEAPTSDDDNHDDGQLF